MPPLQSLLVLVYLNITWLSAHGLNRFPAVPARLYQTKQIVISKNAGKIDKAVKNQLPFINIMNLNTLNEWVF